MSTKTARRDEHHESVALTLRLRDGAGASRKRPAPGQRSSRGTGPTQPRHRPAASARGTCPHARYLGRRRRGGGGIRITEAWLMPSPSASDGGSDNTSVAAAAVWMRMLAGMLPPKMLSTAAAAGRGAQVAAQDQRAPSGRRRLSQLRSRHSTPGTHGIARIQAFVSWSSKKRAPELHSGLKTECSNSPPFPLRAGLDISSVPPLAP